MLEHANHAKIMLATANQASKHANHAKIMLATC